jgi:tetratricopeptide (TPR) repeat protein
MLQEMDQLGFIRTQLDVLKQAYVKDNRIIKIIEKVAISLSEYHYITLMINNKDYDGALRTIEGLSIFERSREEVINIHATALFEKGKNRMESDMTEEAIELWKEVLNINKLSDEYSEEILTISKAKAADLLQRNPESAVRLICDCLELAKNDPELEQLLALAYSRLGMRKLGLATQEFEKDKDRDKIKKAIKSAVADLEESVKLNPSDANTIENLRLARSYIDTLDIPVTPPVNNTTVSLGFNDEGIKLLKEAEEYSKSGFSGLAVTSANNAVDSFRQAHRLNPADSVIEKNISIALDWVAKYTREDNTKQNRGQAKKGSFSVANTFFILAIIAFALLWFLDKKIV